MRPDEPARPAARRPQPNRGGDPWWRPRAGTPADETPLDRDLEPLVADLEAAGAHARARLDASGSARPDPGFAADLRSQLLASWPAREADAGQQAGAGRSSADAGPASPDAGRAAADGASAPDWPLVPEAGPRRAGGASLLRREARLATDQRPAVAGRAPAAAPAPRTGAVVDAVPEARVRLAPRMALQLSGIRPSRRWGVLALAAALIVAVVGLD